MSLVPALKDLYGGPGERLRLILVGFETTATIIIYLNYINDQL